MPQTILNREFVIKSTSNNNMLVSGYASVFDVTDDHNDIILKGAFDNITHTTNIKFLWQHDHTKPIGIITSIAEDDYGLYIEGVINCNTQQGKEAVSLIKQGAINGLSVGFVSQKEQYNHQGIREILSADLHEVSLVTFPANKNAKINILDTALAKANRALSRLSHI